MNRPIKQLRTKNGLRSTMTLHLSPDLKQRVIAESKRQNVSQQFLINEKLAEAFGVDLPGEERSGRIL